MEKGNLYDTLKAAGCIVENHYGTLFVRATPRAEAIVKAFKVPFHHFADELDKKLWMEISPKRKKK